MRPPIDRLTKKEISWLNDHTCRHGHTYLHDYNCFLRDDPKESPFSENIGFLDIEATGLKGNWDFMLCYSLENRAGNKQGRKLTQNEILTYEFDKNLVQELIRDMKKFHRLVVYYGGDYKYDIPFIRTRAEKWRLAFPEYRDAWVTDLYAIVKAKLCLHRSRLETVCQHLGIPSKQHRLIPDIWQKAQAGHEKSLAWIFSHCQDDTKSLRLAWERLNKYSVPRPKRSI